MARSKEGWAGSPSRYSMGSKKVRSAPWSSMASTSSPLSLTLMRRVRCSSEISRLGSGNAMETGLPTAGLGR